MGRLWPKATRGSSSKAITASLADKMTLLVREYLKQG